MADKMLDFMNAFIDSGKGEINGELFELEQEYSKRFGHGIPREMFPPSIHDENIKDAIKKCLESGADDLFAILDISIDDKMMY